MRTKGCDHAFTTSGISANGKKIGPLVVKQSIFKAKRTTEGKYPYLSSIAGMKLLFKAHDSEWVNSINYKWFSCVNRRSAVCCEDTEVSFLLFN